MLKTLVIGHLGRDAVVNNVNGRNVINFTVAHSEKWRDQQGQVQERTTWVDCSYWTDRTAIAPYLQKGTQVYCEGTPEVRTFVRQDKSTGASLSLRVHSIQLLGAKKDNSGPAHNPEGYMGPKPNQQAGPQQYSNAPGFQSQPLEDDLPF